jgi:transcriptional regulator with XRE-family HTH domain
MTIGDRLKQLRKELGISQEAMGHNGFVSTPGWIKLENGQRLPSEKLIERLCAYAQECGFDEGKAHKLKVELLVLKYAYGKSSFLQVAMTVYAAKYRIGVLATVAVAGAVPASKDKPESTKKRDRRSSPKQTARGKSRATKRELAVA